MRIEKMRVSVKLQSKMSSEYDGMRMRMNKEKERGGVCFG